MLSVENISKSFGSRKVLQDLSFTVRPGEIFGFVGSNGAGKTTAMRIMLGLLSKDSGQVTWNGQPIDFAARQRIGYMPEERGLYPKMQVDKQLIYFARLHGMSPDAAQAAMERWTDRLGVGSRREDAVQKLSLGNQQRVQLAAALIHDPELLILDEPFSGLDPVAVRTMSETLRQKADEGVPVIFSSHQLDLVERLCDSVGILAGGNIVARGTVDELRNSGNPPYALAVRAEEAALRTALTQAGFTVHPDPLAGTSEAPLSAGIARVLVETWPAPAAPGTVAATGTSATSPVAPGTGAAAANPAPTADPTAALLAVAQQAGTVVEFAQRRPHLTELFRDVVQVPSANEDDAATPKKKRGLFGSLFGKKAK
ncbi:ABC transporter ATP-binding protein [Actinotignum sp. GS-2025d]|uniref:ABC transporter ATP-binding protein n=1 Tax=Actinotignum sp. GS-2025d TaxID=3427277 RepID=UPI003F476036